MSDWISVKDRLPEIKEHVEQHGRWAWVEKKSDPVLVYTSDEEMDVHIYVAWLETFRGSVFPGVPSNEEHAPEWVTFESDEYDHGEEYITHWMPLPEVPKAD